MIQRLQIARVKWENGIQPREVLDWNVVNEYAERMQAGDVFPPIIAFFDGTTYWLAAGFHRIEALHKAGFFEIDVDVREGSKRDAILFAVGDNATHGLRRTNADKRRAVLMLLNDAEWHLWTDQEIARRCAVDPKTVGNLRAQSNYGISIDTTRTVQRGSQTYPMQTTNIGKKSRKPMAEPTPAPEPPSDDTDMDAEDYDHMATDEDGLLLLEDPVEITIPTKDMAEAARIIALYMDVNALIDALARVQTPA